MNINDEAVQIPAGDKSDIQAPPQRTQASHLQGLPLIIVVLSVVSLALSVFSISLTIAVSRSGSDLNAVREAARSGALEAVVSIQSNTLLQATTSVSAPTSGTPTLAPVSLHSFTLRDSNRIGRKDAPVIIVQFADFQCPYCRRTFQTVEPKLIKDYVDTGKVALIYKHFAFLGKESIWAAEAAECAADQGKFWAYHNLLFAKQSGENQGVFTKDNLIKFANELNLDVAKFEPCLRNDETLERVRIDTDEAQRVGIDGTPAYYINGQPILGAKPYDAFQATIEQALKVTGK